MKTEGDTIDSKSCLLTVSTLAIGVEGHDGVITGLVIEATICSVMLWSSIR